MFCRKCGVCIPDGETKCPACDTEIVVLDTAEIGEPAVETTEMPETEDTVSKKDKVICAVKEAVRPATDFVKKQDRKKVILCVVACVVLLVGGLLAMKFNCDTKACNEFISEGSYCSSHRCWMPGCDNERERSDKYCSLHITLNEFQAKAGLDISGVYVTSNSVSTIAKGTVRNTSTSNTYSFVKVKGAFKTYSGSTVDTDWTYAVGGEGLEPGESAPFEIYVDKNYSIDSCDVTVMDYDYE